MKLTKPSGEWSDELLEDAAKKGVPPNQHPAVLKAMKPAPYPLADEDAALSSKQREVRDVQKTHDPAPEKLARKLEADPGQAPPGARLVQGKWYVEKK